MKKFNLSEIMKRAWAIVKNTGSTISAALRKSWAIAKEAVTVFVDGTDKQRAYAKRVVDSNCAIYQENTIDQLAHDVKMQGEKKSWLKFEEGSAEYERRKRGFQRRKDMLRQAEELIADYKKINSAVFVLDWNGCGIERTVNAWKRRNTK